MTNNVLITAMITPRTRRGEVDFATYSRLVHMQKEAVDAVLALGSTARALLLNTEEKQRLLETTLEVFADPQRVYVGINRFCAHEAIEEIVAYQRLGCTQFLINPPAYIRPTQDEIVSYYTSIYHSTHASIIAYHHPGRCGVAIEQETWKKIASVLKGVKDASEDVSLQLYLIHQLKLNVWTGSDIQLPTIRGLAAVGAMSVISNLYPNETKQILEGCRQTLAKMVPKLLEISTHPNPLTIHEWMRQKGVIHA